MLIWWNESLRKSEQWDQVGPRPWGRGERSVKWRECMTFACPSTSMDWKSPLDTPFSVLHPFLFIIFWDIYIHTIYVIYNFAIDEEINLRLIKYWMRRWREKRKIWVCDVERGVCESVGDLGKINVSDPYFTRVYVNVSKGAKTGDLNVGNSILGNVVVPRSWGNKRIAVWFDHVITCGELSDKLLKR